MTLRPSIIWYNHLHQTLLVTCLGQHESRTLVRAILPIQWSRERSLKPDCLALNGVSWASLVAQMVKNPTAVQETWVRSLGWEDSPGGGHGNPLQYSCLENPRGQRSLVASPWGHKEWDTTKHSTDSITY